MTSKRKTLVELGNSSSAINIRSVPAPPDDQLSSDNECINAIDKPPRETFTDSSEDCEEISTEDANFHLRKVSPFLFRNVNLEPLTFVLMLNDFNLELKAKDIISKGGGLVYSSQRLMDPYSIVLVKGSSIVRAHVGPVFTIQFLIACIRRNKIVNINNYMKTCNNAPQLHKFDFMDVVYFKRINWSEVPEHIILNKKLVVSKGKTNLVSGESSEKIVSLDLTTIDDSSDDSLQETPVIKNKQVSKHTRMAYSSVEDANIVKYLVDKKAYGSIKGQMIWKSMEKKNVCPLRTWQSMKEHFLKKLLPHIDYFSFLTDNQKKKFKQYK
ncbi:uncharacterized protein LOC111046294 isoform X2 [Nilaparvata lugens]|nr:uncharacterized protein LOC111046294 isoform X2 [Nilaparvata lugens]